MQVNVPFVKVSVENHSQAFVLHDLQLVEVCLGTVIENDTGISQDWPNDRAIDRDLGMFRSCAVPFDDTVQSAKGLFCFLDRFVDMLSEEEFFV